MVLRRSSSRGAEPLPHVLYVGGALVSFAGGIEVPAAEVGGVLVHPVYDALDAVVLAAILLQHPVEQLLLVGTVAVAESSKPHAVFVVAAGLNCTRQFLAWSSTRCMMASKVGGAGLGGVALGAVLLAIFPDGFVGCLLFLLFLQHHVLIEPVHLVGGEGEGLGVPAEVGFSVMGESAEPHHVLALLVGRDVQQVIVDGDGFVDGEMVQFGDGEGASLGPFVA